MVLLQSCIFRTSLYTRFLVRYSSTNATIPSIDFKFQPKFNNSEQEKILNILNQPNNKEHLMSLNVSQTKIKNLEIYKKKNGPFKSLNDLLEVDGLGVKLLEKLCKQIISEPSSTENLKKTNNGNNKKLKQFLVPALPTHISISSAVGIHLAPMGVSWAKLHNSEGQLECWGHLDFTSLPKKMLPVDTFRLAINILSKLPIGDIYVFEGSPSLGLPGQKQQSTVTSYTQHLELSSMLLALINTSSTHNIDYIDKFDANLENRVYFLRSKLPARLFKTLVGNECVSSTSTVLQLLDSSFEKDFKLPCSPVTVDQKLKSDYLSQPSAYKELLGQALMLAVTFIDLCIKKNVVSINAVAPRKT